MKEEISTEHGTYVGNKIEEYVTVKHEKKQQIHVRSIRQILLNMFNDGSNDSVASQQWLPGVMWVTNFGCLFEFMLAHNHSHSLHT
jgi:hypothetical protein